MAETNFENATITGKNVKVGQTSYLKYYDTGSEKWERLSGSGAPYIRLLPQFEDAGSNALNVSLVSGSISISSLDNVRITGSIAISGSINNWPSSYIISPVISGSGVYTQASAIMITGSINTTVSVSTDPVVSGSGVYTQASAVMVTGSVNLNTSVSVTADPVISGSGIYTYTSAVMVTGSVNLNTGLAATTGSINNWPSTQAVTQSGQWTVNVTGSSAGLIVTGSININSVPAVSGSINNWPSSYLSTQSGQYVVAVTGSIITGSIDNWPTTQAVTQSGQWSIYATGSATGLIITGSINVNNLPALYVTSPVASGSGIYTQLSAQMVTGSVNINNFPSGFTVDVTKVAGESVQVSGGTEAKSQRVTIANDSTGLLSVDDNGGSLTVDGHISGSGIYSYASAQMVTGSVNLNSVPAITGSINNWPSTYSVTPVVSGSGVYDQKSAVMVTGSVNLNTTVSVSTTADPVTSGSGIYTYASAVMVTGSVNLNTGLAATTGSIDNWPSTYASTQSGIWNEQAGQSGSWNVTGSINNWPTVYASTQSGNWYSGISGSWKDTISSGASTSLAANSGSMLLPSGSGKIKIFDIGFSPSSAGFHAIYFGNTTGSGQSKLILSCSGSGTFRQTFVFPRVSATQEALYAYSTTAETQYYIDFSYLVD